MVGADLANVVNEAALLAARRGADKIYQEDFEEAKDKVTMGIERKSRVINEDDKRVIAYHEAGHTMVAKFMPEADPVHKVTIIPRGQALGVTHQLPLDDRYNYSRGYLRTQLAIMLGGRTAEEIVFNEITTGAGNDIKRATDMARKMVTEWGMSDRLGPLSFGDKEEEIFLGREIAQHRDFSEETAQQIDSEVRELIDEAHTKARDILTENLGILHTMAESLLEHETLNEKDIDILVKGGSVNGKDSPGADDSAKSEESTSVSDVEKSEEVTPSQEMSDGDGEKSDGAAGDEKEATEADDQSETDDVGKV